MADPTTSADARAALLAEREQVLAELAGIEVEGPGQMTYGSQAAAATHVFEQQRDLALRDRNEQHLAAVDAALARLDAGTYGLCESCAKPDRARAARGAAVGRAVHRLPALGPPPMSDAGPDLAPDEALDDGPPVDLVTLDEIRAAAATLDGIARRTPLVPFGRAESGPVAEGRVPPADRRVQDPWRLHRRGGAVARTNAPAA